MCIRDRLYKEVWIGLGGTQSAVYATEVSAEEYLASTTEETEKVACNSHYFQAMALVKPLRLSLIHICLAVILEPHMNTVS